MQTLEELTLAKKVNIDDYLNLYKIVLDDLEDKTLLGVFSKEDVQIMLDLGGKIWLYYDKDIPVSSVFMLPIPKDILKKHNLKYKEEEITSVGPIMVHPNYRGNKLQKQMLIVLEKYAKSKNFKYIYTKVSEKNIYSKKNFEDLGYKKIEVFHDERGNNISLLKKL